MATCESTRAFVIVGGFFLFFAIGVECNNEKPLVVLPILARNKEHTLPYYLACIEQLDYPKSRITIWIRTDHNVDGTEAMLRQWVRGVGAQYHSVDLPPGPGDHQVTSYPGERGPLDWVHHRYTHVIALREQAVRYARETVRAHYILFTDCDNFINNTGTLDFLIQQDKIVVAPMLTTANSRYSNYWAAVNEQAYARCSDLSVNVPMPPRPTLSIPVLINLPVVTSFCSVHYFPPEMWHNITSSSTHSV